MDAAHPFLAAAAQDDIGAAGGRPAAEEEAGWEAIFGLLLDELGSSETESRCKTRPAKRVT